MVGYNAAKMTDATFDKRTDRISKTLGDKYGKCTRYTRTN